jgi:hypothetical protein
MPPRIGVQAAKVSRGLIGSFLVVALGLALAGSTGVAVGGAIGAMIFYLSVQAARTWRELRLKRDGSGLLARSAGGEGGAIPLRAGQVRVRLGQRMESNRQGDTVVEFVALDHGTETYELLEGYSHAERAWAVEEIERWLGHRAPGA